jgi:hypothetical protein
MTTGPFRIATLPNGTAQVSVGDTDLTGMVVGLILDVRPGQAARLVVELAGDAAVEGVADVSLSRQRDGFASFLDAIDADELEKAALNGLDWDDGSATQAILDVLKRWAGDL